MRTFLHYARQVTEDIEPCGWSKKEARMILKNLLTPRYFWQDLAPSWYGKI